VLEMSDTRRRVMTAWQARVVRAWCMLPLVHAVHCEQEEEGEEEARIAPGRGVTEAAWCGELGRDINQGRR